MEEAARLRGIGGFGQILAADQQGARVIAPYKRARKQKSHEIVPSYESLV